MMQLTTAAITKSVINWILGLTTLYYVVLQTGGSSSGVKRNLFAQIPKG